MRTLIHERVEQAREGRNPTVIRRLPSGWAVLGDQQFLPGYSLLLADPVVSSLNELQAADRAQFMLDMGLLGDALLLATEAVRVNYGIYGNTDGALHAHLWARYSWESVERRRLPAWMYSPEERAVAPFDPVEHADLMRRIRDALDYV